jgi:hypothetical protein
MMGTTGPNFTTPHEYSNDFPGIAGNVPALLEARGLAVPADYDYPAGETWTETFSFAASDGHVDSRAAQMNFTLIADYNGL